MSENKELKVIEGLSALDVFSGDNSDDIIERVRQEATAEVYDINTAKGRKRAVSIARQVSRTKTTLDNLGKNLVADWKSRSKVVDDERKKMRDSLDDLRDEIRLPVTQFEEIEKKAIAERQSILDSMTTLSMAVSVDTGCVYSISELKNNLEALNYIIIDESLKEVELACRRVHGPAIEKLTYLIESEIQREIDEAEQAKAQAEESERQQKERDQRIAKEAAEAATLEAERIAKAQAEEIDRQTRAEAEKVKAEKVKADKIKAEKAVIDADKRAAEFIKQAERHRVERERADKQNELNRIERERLLKLKAEKEKHQAITNERLRLEGIARQEAEKVAARERDTNHRRKINSASLACFVKEGISNDQSMKILNLISKNKIDFVSINY